MKKLLIAIVLSSTFFVGVTAAKADKPVAVDSNGVETAWSDTTCADIKSGTIVDSANNPVTVGFDQFGYNYQAHMFNGTYDSSDRTLDGTYWGGTGDYVDDKLIMKWSDAWLANVDCNGDHKLDRGLVNGTVSGFSMGWLTNHVVGDYTLDGEVQNWTEFTKIVWTGTGDLWGAYTTIEDVWNDPAAEMHGINTKVGAPGFGLNEHWTVTE